MFFNSINFALFFPFVFIIYWFLLDKKVSLQNIFLLVASYFFYACWDYRFLFLLIFSTLLDYYTGLKIDQSADPRLRKIWLCISVLINLGFLGFFKYYNFFIASFGDLLSMFGMKSSFWTLSVILPVGISFYTFHGLSYVIDIYKKRIKPVNNFITYSVFVSFFPLLVAGPIERATHLLPQLQMSRKFKYASMIDGMRQILWGLFKKIVIADNCARFANDIFDNYAHYSGSTLIFGAFFFGVQIYCDFSGYSDIALGAARLLGIELLRNFAFPYFSRDIAEFWRRWHISLSSWFKDYLYIPLGGSKGGKWMQVRNIFIIFLVSGFWHGANWTFIAWGALHAIYFLPLLLLNRNRTNMAIVAQNKRLPSLSEFSAMLVTFSLVTFAWIFFRANNIHHAFNYIQGIFSPSLFLLPQVLPVGILALIAGFIIVEWIGRREQFAIANLWFGKNVVLRWAFYYCMVLIILYYSGTHQKFIYFQF